MGHYLNRECLIRISSVVCRANGRSDASLSHPSVDTKSMKSSLIAALFTIAATTTPLLSQSGQQPKRQKSPIKVEMEKMDEALDVVADFLDKPEGKAPLAEITALTTALMESKKHAPRAAARLPKEKQAEFVLAYQVEINKALRGVLDLEDAMLTKDYKAGKAAITALKAMEKAGHKVFKPRRRRGGAKRPASGGKK